MLASELAALYARDLRRLLQELRAFPGTAALWSTGPGMTEAVARAIPAVIAALSSDDLDGRYPENVLGIPMSTRQFLIHLHGHFNYHLGQIDYLRRLTTGTGAIALASLDPDPTL